MDALSIDSLAKLISDAKRIAESRGLYMLVYLLSLAEAELRNEDVNKRAPALGEPPEPIRPFDRNPENDN